MLCNFSGTCLCEADSVEQLKPVKREELGQDFGILHVSLTVLATIVLFRPVQPRCHLSAQVAIVEAAHLERVQENSQRGQ